MVTRSAEQTAAPGGSGAGPALEVGTPGAPEERSVVGELHAVDDVISTRLDVLKRHPALLQRRAIALADGRLAQVYGMRDERLRGRKVTVASPS